MDWINIARENLAQGLHQLRQRMRRLRKQQTHQKQRQKVQVQKTIQEQKPQKLNANARQEATKIGQELRQMGVEKGKAASLPKQAAPSTPNSGNKSYQWQGVRPMPSKSKGKGMSL